MYGFVTPEIVITPTKNLGSNSVRVELLKETSKLVNAAPDGTVYKNLNIWLGTSGFGTSEHITDAVVRFTVEKTWLSDNKFSKDEITLVKWEADKWVKLSTTMVREEGASDHVYYEAHTTSFSPFTIVAKFTGPAVAETISGKGAVPEKSGVIPTPYSEKTTTPVPTKEEETPGFEAISALIGLMVVVFLIRRRI